VVVLVRPNLQVVRLYGVVVDGSHWYVTRGERAIGPPLPTQKLAKQIARWLELAGSDAPMNDGGKMGRLIDAAKELEHSVTDVLETLAKYSGK
jgi:hypothetical protein